MGNSYKVTIFISGGGGYAAYAKKSKQLSHIDFKIIADRQPVKHPECVDEYLIYENTKTYWEEFSEYVKEADLTFINFNWIIPKYICRLHSGKLINQHPSLLPDFPGLNIQDRVLKSGITQSGTTFHFVDENVDSGPIIWQTFFDISRDDTIASLSYKNWIHSRDHYVNIINWFSKGRISLQNRNVFIDGHPPNFSTN
ncbi:phosphoribosylglycinamide formyltransferase [Curvivirga aplysinae]|uniref:phosphoribosylglycinamide formyltransferase n=1 Tax=Curvivirga aplysinae TaxID=2529852 RepID=UPI001C3FF2F2|nr:formyltransferase family protein [Curvivirga aplysinae]